MAHEAKPAGARSDDIPRAVEYLIQIVLRFVLWTLSLGFGVGALVSFIERWPLYVGIPCALLFFLTAIGGFVVKSSPARLVVGPSARDIGIVVPRSDVSDETQPREDS